MRASNCLQQKPSEEFTTEDKKKNRGKNLQEDSTSWQDSRIVFSRPGDFKYRVRKPNV